MDAIRVIIGIPIAIFYAVSFACAFLALMWCVPYSATYESVIIPGASKASNSRILARWPAQLFWMMNLFFLWLAWQIQTSSHFGDFSHTVSVVVSLGLVLCCPALNGLWGYIAALQDVRQYLQAKTSVTEEELFEMTNARDVFFDKWKVEAMKTRKARNELLRSNLNDESQPLFPRNLRD